MLKISLIVPVYNCEEYLEECIASVLTQTYTNFELVLVDDGSTDGSTKICDYYADKFPNLVVVSHNENHGPYFSRLYGIERATGDVVAFLDSDDCLRKDALDIICSTFNKYDCDMVIYNAQQCTAFPSMQIPSPFNQETLFEGVSKRKLYRKVIMTRSLNSVCLKAVKRQYAILPDCVPTNCSLKHGEDLLLSASFITSAPKIVFTQEGIYHYRLSPKSITHSYNIELNASLKAVHKILDDLIDYWEMPELIKLHNSRKVSGWIDVLIIMLKAKSGEKAKELISAVKNMVNDPYFILAYQNMDKSYLSTYYRILAWLMYKKCYFGLIWLVKAKTAAAQIIRKLCRR